MKIKFCGAAREVTGSCHFVTLADGYKILLDCGLYQGHSDAMKEFNATWHFDPAQIDTVVLSHAHIDHAGRLPKLVRDGFKGTIYATPATRDLCSIMLLDAAVIQEKDAAYFNNKRAKSPEEFREPLYTEADVTETMKLFVSVPYEKWFVLRQGIDLLFRDTGHILGSASVSLHVREANKFTRIAFSGDIGRPNRPILSDPQPMEPADIVICESTYGDRLHDEAPQEMARFVRIIEEAIARNGKVIVPAFSVGRTQEIVYMLDQMVSAGKFPRIPVVVDSPLSVNATDIFIRHPECYDTELQQYLLKDPNPFGFNSLKYVRDVEESKALNAHQGPMLIIASSGMGNAGRVKHHLYNNIQNAQNTILIVGYATPETPAGQLRDGATTIKMFGEKLQVNAQVEVMDSFSAHGDQDEMLAFLQNQKSTVKQVFLVHGVIDRMEKWRSYLQTNGFDKAEVQIPELGQEISC